MGNATLGSPPSDIKRVVYKRLEPGDERKFRAESHDADTGGGARDLRFNYNRFRAIMSKLFPHLETPQRQDRATEEWHGHLVYTEPGSGQEQAHPTQFVSPTSSRPSEGRIPRVHQNPALPTLPPSVDLEETSVYLLLVQDEEDQVRAHLAWEQDLHAGRWHRSISEPILQKVATTPENQSVTGWIDFTPGASTPYG